MPESWNERHAKLLAQARKMKAQPVVSREEVVALQAEIRHLEQRKDRPTLGEAVAMRVYPSLETEKVGRVPDDRSPLRAERRCPLRKCDGSGWHLHPHEDVAHPCRCQRLPRDGSARRQNRRILHRHLALSLDAPPLATLDSPCLEALHGYCADIEKSVGEGSGLWLAGGTDRETACAFIAGEALRHSLSVLIYPVDELIGRLRRLAARGDALFTEIYETLASIDLLVLVDLDAAAAPSRYPERLSSDPAEEERSASEETPSILRSVEQADEPRDDEPMPYCPAMTDSDLSRLCQIIDQRWMAERATVVSTTSDRGMLEECLLRVAGEWPAMPVDDGSQSMNLSREASRRAIALRQLLSRLLALGGSPIPAVSRHSGSVRAADQSRSNAGSASAPGEAVA